MLDKINAIIAGIKKVLYLNEIPKKYIEGMELLNKNSGVTSLVFKKNDNEVRIFTRDNMKYEWLIHGLKIADFVDMIESNKYPKFSLFPIYVIDMPFLYPLSTENKKKINKALKECKDLFNHYGSRRREDLINILMEYFEDKNQILYDVFYFLSDYDEMYQFDLSLRNFRQDKNGNIILLDPVVNNELITSLRLL